MHSSRAYLDLTDVLITDRLAEGDASPSELGALLAMPSNLLAHHLRVLEDARIITRRRSAGDHRRSYLRLVPDPVPAGDHGSFDAALDDLSRRVGRLAPQVSEVPRPSSLARTEGCRGGGGQDRPEAATAARQLAHAPSPFPIQISRCIDYSRCIEFCQSM
ncbi:ArsR family transcriptional regulator [Trebonia kvetii]|uniref:ArsR family transcriptional regulator n=1 Tax=Trebonia kvetii TaxID=2480626 RepID=A0A6P2C714_9ACTN|nr:winged helix-turn-helix domain-containing protein [Trebonia kvetii]TVZ07204.1 ArsR family transcriptional regulator [Trebonia kvetii]